MHARRNTSPTARPIDLCGRVLAGLGAAMAMLPAWGSEPPQKITYEDNVLPIFRDNCLKCHNPDKLKGDLDLTSFSSAVKGGGSGATLNPGDPESSQLYKSITHAEEPTMPPNGKLSERDIATIRSWIQGGLLQGANSKALAASKPAADLSLKASSIGRPEGPPPMPSGLSFSPVVRSQRASASLALASSPWAPVVAIGGTKQILLHDSSTVDFLGVLPFPEGVVCDLKFSRNGKLLVAGGGRGGHSGVVAIWDITTGKRVVTIGDQFDSVLAADLSADQERVALGGPDKVLKIYLTRDGSLQHRLKKHTEWVTAVEFSPNGKFLASGDRNGGLLIWEAESGQEMFTLAGHKGAISSVSWRADSEMLASASEDGTIKLWKASDGASLRSITAHAGGVLAAKFGPDGRLVSGGRDNKIQLWETSGKAVGPLPFKGDLPTRVVFNDDGKRVIGSDWQGRVAVWEIKTGVVVGELESNPQTVVERVQAIRDRIAQLNRELIEAVAFETKSAAERATLQKEQQGLNASLEQTRGTLAMKEAELMRASGQVSSDPTAQSRADQARSAVRGLHARVTALQGQLAQNDAKLKAADKNMKAARETIRGVNARLETAEAALARWQGVLEREKTNGGARQASL